jgi:alkylated DNA repair dioxygenase AlkB
MARDQLPLFGGEKPMPAGFRYRADVLSRDQERDLLARVGALPFREFEFQGYLGKRRVVSYGWRYDFNEKTLRRADDMPPFLRSLREVAARFAEVPPGTLQQALVTEYGPGAGIGWHRDKAMFGDVIGISLLASCVFRLRHSLGTSWERATITAEPRSAYLLRGPARTEWEHSIPPVRELRYSVTFRNFREDGPFDPGPAPHDQRERT